MNFLKQLSGISSNNMNSRREAKNDILTLNTKHPRTVRIVPYPDRLFVFPYRVCWVELHTNDGKRTFSSMLTFPQRNPGNDKLMSLLYHIISINRKNRSNNSEAPDVIPVQYHHAGRPNFPASIRLQYALQAIEIKNSPNGAVMNTFPDSKLPKVQIMNVTGPTFRTISESIENRDPGAYGDFRDSDTKKPYPLDPTNPLKFRWVTNDPTLAIHIERPNKQGAKYSVQPNPFTKFPALPKKLYEKDSNGKYKYLDDPKWLYEPSKTREPNMYRKAYRELSKRLDQYEESGHNPYQDQINKVKKNTQSSDDGFHLTKSQKATIPFSSDYKDPDNSNISKTSSEVTKSEIDANLGADTNDKSSEVSSESSKPSASSSSSAKEQSKSSKAGNSETSDKSSTDSSSDSKSSSSSIDFDSLLGKALGKDN